MWRSVCYLVMTPIIITGGSICQSADDGAVRRRDGQPVAHGALEPIAIAITLVVGLLGGTLNATMITKLKAPPLIVTLGTFSLFRGIAEGLTRGIENYSGFSPSFLFLGQGYVFGVIPTQLFILLPVIAAVWWWLHRTGFGRSFYAIGFSQEGSRYAGIKVRRRLNFIYCLSGLAASLAAVIYVAHLGQAKSDAGTNTN